ncbi:DUF362 domain-containing protein [bacterium]|nr:DUF362 domain-containing protein [bacterium]
MSKIISRRSFLKRTALLSAVMSGGFNRIWALPKSQFIREVDDLTDQPVVVWARHPDIYSITGGFSSSIIEMVMDEAIINLTGIEDTGTAWLSLFPNITASCVIAIKINCVMGDNPMSVHQEIVNIVIDKLTNMPLSGGPLPPENIIVWDKYDENLTGAGYSLNYGGAGVQCYGAQHEGVGYDESNPLFLQGHERFITNIIAERCDYLINIPVIKDHNIAGTTGALKNHYGTVNIIDIDGDTLHTNQCDPYIAQINADDRILSKQVLILYDAIFGQYEGGPYGPDQEWLTFPESRPSGLILSRDPVAADTFEYNIIMAERELRGFSIVNTPHIQTAAALGLGSMNYQLIEISEFPVRELTIHHEGEDIVLNWNALPGANQYKIYRDSDPYFNPSGAPYAVTQNTEWRDEGVLNSSVKWFYRIIAEVSAQ